MKNYIFGAVSFAIEFAKNQESTISQLMIFSIGE